eukprot:GHVN01082083.1.p1 GENE.GHVN01082083.1~~GHVN01082083.1.p1  ORF type:complete len:632 (+),score=146.45 GHVN01082083.1:94-1989(+)
MKGGQIGLTGGVYRYSLSGGAGILRGSQGVLVVPVEAYLSKRWINVPPYVRHSPDQPPDKSFFTPPNDRTWSKQHPYLRNTRPLVDHEVDLTEPDPKFEKRLETMRSLTGEASQSTYFRFMGLPDVVFNDARGADTKIDVMDPLTLAMVMDRCVQYGIGDDSVWASFGSRYINISTEVFEPDLGYIFKLFGQANRGISRALILSLMGRVTTRFREFDARDCANLIEGMVASSGTPDTNTGVERRPLFDESLFSAIIDQAGTFITTRWDSPTPHLANLITALSAAGEFSMMAQLTASCTGRRTSCEAHSVFFEHLTRKIESIIEILLMQLVLRDRILEGADSVYTGTVYQPPHPNDFELWVRNNAHLHRTSLHARTRTAFDVVMALRRWSPSSITSNNSPSEVSEVSQSESITAQKDRLTDVKQASIGRLLTEFTSPLVEFAQRGEVERERGGEWTAIQAAATLGKAYATGEEASEVRVRLFDGSHSARLACVMSTLGRVSDNRIAVMEGLAALLDRCEVLADSLTPFELSVLSQSLSEVSGLTGLPLCERTRPKIRLMRGNQGNVKASGVSIPVAMYSVNGPDVLRLAYGCDVLNSGHPLKVVLMSEIEARYGAHVDAHRLLKAFHSWYRF